MTTIKVLDRDYVYDQLSGCYIRNGVVIGRADDPPNETISRLQSLLEEAAITLRHARVFIDSRQKMHPDGVMLYDELLAKLEATGSQATSTA